MLDIIRKPRTFCALATGLSPAAIPAMAADPGAVPTGITAVGPSLLIFTVAGAVLLTLLVRASARHVTRQVGERSGNHRIRSRLRAAGRHVRSNFLLPGAYGGIAKIDHALLTPAGLLCIRALHVSGRVAGGENEPQWTLTTGSRRRRFLNPLIQNEGRARALRKIVPDVPVTNLVVFTGNVTFDGEPPPNVIPLDRLADILAQQAALPGRVAEPDAAWLNVNAAVLEGPDARKDFAAQISFS